MKKILLSILVLGSFSTFAATDAKIIRAVFNEDQIISKMGEDNLDDIQITEKSEGKYKVVINSRAPLADGCSYSAQVTEKLQRGPVGPARTMMKRVLEVSNVKANCPSRR